MVSCLLSAFYMDFLLENKESLLYVWLSYLPGFMFWGDGNGKEVSHNSSDG